MPRRLLIQTSRLTIALLAVLPVPPARAAELYLLDQTHGAIMFSATHFGSFSSEGRFQRFLGRLLIDRVHPERTTVDVTADTTSVTIPWADGDALLKSPPFFDATRFPSIRFTSRSIEPVDRTHFRVNGTLEMRGVRKPITLDATLEKQGTDPASGEDVGDFKVTGLLSRAQFGMTSDTVMISDEVRLSIAARIILPVQAK